MNIRYPIYEGVYRILTDQGGRCLQERQISGNAYLAPAGPGTGSR